MYTHTLYIYIYIYIYFGVTLELLSTTSTKYDVLLMYAPIELSSTQCGVGPVALT